MKQNKEDASELIGQKVDLEKSKKEAEMNAAQKELERDRKIRPIGNYVHESVPVSNNEVRISPQTYHVRRQANSGNWKYRMTTRFSKPGHPLTPSWSGPTVSPTMRF